jgi:hypothetical protein
MDMRERNILSEILRRETTQRRNHIPMLFEFFGIDTKCNKLPLEMNNLVTNTHTKRL